MNRRELIAAAAALPLLGAAKSQSVIGDRPPGIAISIDDFDLEDDPTQTGWQRDRAIRATLAKHGIKAAGFPVGDNIVGAKDGRRVLAAWSAAGHILGNHTYTHPYFTGADPAKEMADILRCEPVVRPYRTFRKLFRFPYLAEGKTAEGRDALRALLTRHGYRTAPVTIDTSDWYINGRLVDRLKRGRGNPVTDYRTYYLAHVMDRALYYDGLAKALFGHSIDHVILLHHKLTTALFLDDVLTMLRMRGWRLVDAGAALAQPELRLIPNALPAGQSLLWALAKERGVGGELRFPAEDGRYEKAAMDALEL